MWISTTGTDFVTTMRKNVQIVMITDENWMLELLDSPAIAQGKIGEDKEALFIQAVTHLMETDFSRLCQVLYRVDVDEQLLKETLERSEAPPAEIIAHLLLERQKQKVALRARFTRNSDDIPEADKW